MVLEPRCRSNTSLAPPAPPDLVVRNGLEAFAYMSASACGHTREEALSGDTIPPRTELLSWGDGSRAVGMCGPWGLGTRHEHGFLGRRVAKAGT